MSNRLVFRLVFVLLCLPVDSRSSQRIDTYNILRSYGFSLTLCYNL